MMFASFHSKGTSPTFNDKLDTTDVRMYVSICIYIITGNIAKTHYLVLFLLTCTFRLLINSMNTINNYKEKYCAINCLTRESYGTWRIQQYLLKVMKMTKRLLKSIGIKFMWTEIDETHQYRCDVHRTRQSDTRKIMTLHYLRSSASFSLTIYWCYRSLIDS